VERRLTVLLAVAILGVHVMIALALALVGPVPCIAYVLVTNVALALLVRRKRAAQRHTGRTCSCCTSTVYDPVEVR
jgi:ABC-type enterochelin transport system permease subunit